MIVLAVTNDPVRPSVLAFFLVPAMSIVAGQFQLLYRFTRVGGGPGSFKAALSARKKQHRSILVLDMLSGIAAVSAVAIIGPAGTIASLFDNNSRFFGWAVVGIFAPLALAGFLRGAVVQGLLKPHWLRKENEGEITAVIAGVNVLRSEAVDLLVRTLWKAVRDENRTGYLRLKHCIEAKIAAGDIHCDDLVADVVDYFEVRRVEIPKEVAKAMKRLRLPNGVIRLKEQAGMDQLVSSLLNTENWEPLERLCPLSAYPPLD